MRKEHVVIVDDTLLVLCCRIATRSRAWLAALVYFVSLTKCNLRPKIPLILFSTRRADICTIISDILRPSKRPESNQQERVADDRRLRNQDAVL